MISPILYTISDFLMDQKEEIKRWERLCRRAGTAEKKTEIEEQKSYAYNQGLQALRRHERELPNCVRRFYLGNGPKPSMAQVSQELQKMNHYSDYKFNRRVIKAAVIATIAILFLLTLFF